MEIFGVQNLLDYTDGVKPFVDAIAFNYSLAPVSTVDPTVRVICLSFVKEPMVRPVQQIRLTLDMGAGDR